MTDNIAYLAMEEVTNDWVETFSDPANQNGFMWRMAAREVLPDWVDPADERVIALCKKAKADCVEYKGN